MTVHSIRSMLGHEVVAVDNAEQLGQVKHFVMSPQGDRIERLHIDGRGKHAEFVSWDDLESFGTDRVMVSAADSPTQSDDGRDLDAARGNIDVIGQRILDTAGFDRGKVADLSFEGDDGRVVSVMSTDGSTIDSSAIRSFGSYALVIDRPAS